MDEKILKEFEEAVITENFMKLEQCLSSHLDLFTEPKYCNFMILSIMKGGFSFQENLNLKLVFQKQEQKSKPKDSIDKIFVTIINLFTKIDKMEKKAKKNIFVLTNTYMLTALTNVITNGNDDEIEEAFKLITPLYQPLRKYLSKKSVINVNVYNVLGIILSTFSNTILNALENSGKISMPAVKQFAVEIHKNVFVPLVKYASGLNGFLMSLGGVNTIEKETKIQVKDQASRLKKIIK